MTEIDETAVATPEPAAEAPAPEPEQHPAETARPKKLNEYSGYIHVGPGAEECEHGTDAACENQDHFHAWCRLPNQFERQDLNTRGAAAAAKRRRSLNEEDSNSRVILDGELEGIKHRGDRDVLVSEIVGLHFLEDHLEATRDVEAEHAEFEQIDDHKERLRVLEEMPEAERPEEEFTTLRKMVMEHTALVNAAREQLEAPRKEALNERTLDELVEIVRDQRIDGLCNQAHSEEYAKWEWYTCTFKPKAPDKPGFPSERAFSSITAFLAGPPEALEAIADKMTRLERDGTINLKGS